MNKVSTEELKRRITAPEELALIDVREAGAFSRAHLLFAVSVPLSRLELGFAVLVPRLGTPIVLCDDCTGVAERAAERLAQFGYTRLEILDGGIGAWQDAGYEIFSGVNVPSKAFGKSSLGLGMKGAQSSSMHCGRLRADRDREERAIAKHGTANARLPTKNELRA